MSLRYPVTTFVQSETTMEFHRSAKHLWPRNRSVGTAWVWTALIIFGLESQLAYAQSFQVLHTFTSVDGANPVSSLTVDRAGNLYGTTVAGGRFGGICGIDGCGTVFRLVPDGAGWVLMPLHFFRGGADGDYANQGVVLGSDGDLYGTTVGGGAPPNSGGIGGAGTIYRLTPSATPCTTTSCFWQENILYRFTGGADGRNPGYGYGGKLTFDQLGNIYGTTPYGGITGPPCNDAFGCGVVYELTPSGDRWAESVVWAFSGSTDGRQPVTGITVGQQNNLYGMTEYGGLYQTGDAYQIAHAGSGWAETTIYNFADYPGAGDLLIDRLGDLYSTAGEDSFVFKLSPGNDGWTLVTLYSFGGGGYLLANGDLTMDEAGNLYGTTYNGGTGGGNVFKLEPAIGGWIYTDLHDFSGSDGLFPFAGVTLDAQGNIFGTTAYGGKLSECHESGCGTVWEITSN